MTAAPAPSSIPSGSPSGTSLRTAACAAPGDASGRPGAGRG
ncbi:MULTISPECIES: hypothetical protein [Kocuria]|nr:hypothetical protein [Kocuria polaris]